MTLNAMTAAQAIIFDFDGVLADTEVLYRKAWEECLRPYGISLNWEEYCRIGRGRTDRFMLTQLLEGRSDLGILAELESEGKRVKEAVRLQCSKTSPIPENVVAMLRGLGGYRVGLVTTSRRPEVEPILEGAGVKGCFGAMVMREDYTHPKPSPEPYLLVQQRLEVRGGWAFEDSEAGMESAAEAGLTVVAVKEPRELPAMVARCLNLC